jgi:mRNA interferase MazF
MSTNYIPDRGEVAWLELNFEDTTQAKKERKPAIIISPKAYNERTGLVIICPIKGKVKGYPFEVLIPDNMKITGVILADQVKSVNWKTRNIEYICKLPEEKFFEILSKLLTLL